MNAFEQARIQLTASPRTWLVTGAAGFIGSHLVETLLSWGQLVRGLDNFSTGHRQNLEAVRHKVGPEAWARFRFSEANIADLGECRLAVEGVQYVLHQAALGSVPRSVADPLTSHHSNVDGFLNMAVAARDAKVLGFVYASSSSVYGDDAELPKREARIGQPLSPYAITKRVNELYAHNFSQLYGFPAVGLRYFNVFGPRQDPNGPYAAVIPRWIAAMAKGEPCVIYGDGQTSRDFCFIDNVVQANLLAALGAQDQGGEVFNVACGATTSLLALHGLLAMEVEKVTGQKVKPVIHEPARAGDIRHSHANIEKVQSAFGYKDEISIVLGLRQTIACAGIKL